MDLIPPTPRTWRDTIAAFLVERLARKLDKLADDDPERAATTAAFRPEAWIASAAARAGQLQVVTHALKALHPDARGTSLFVRPGDMAQSPALGSHALGAAFTADAVGNAAALDVYAFLRQQLGGQTLLDALAANAPDALAALHDDAATATRWRDAFVALTAPRAGGPASHVLAKQVYWLTGSDACDDAHYVLLAPLFPTTLAHAVHGVVDAHRFGEANKAARAARNAGQPHTEPYHEYRDLAVRAQGGSKPQNISQLTSERRGVNYLLASLPPTWAPSALRLPRHARSVFDKLFPARPTVKAVVGALLAFLQTDPPPTMETRDRRDAFIETLIDELLSFGGELQLLEPGWSRAPDFEDLDPAQKLWLDPGCDAPKGEDSAEDAWWRGDWPREVAGAFARWLNAALQQRLPVGEIESREWQRMLMGDDDWRLIAASAAASATHAPAAGAQP